MLYTPAESSSVFSRGALIITLAAIFFVVLTSYVGSEHLTDVLLLLSIDGMIAMVWICCAASLGSALLRLGRIEQRGALEWATAVALGVGTMSLVALGLGLAGWLNTATAVLLLVVSLIVEPRRKIVAIRNLQNVSLNSWLRTSAGAHWLWIAVAPLAAVAVTAASMAPVLLWKEQGDPHPYDVVEYHLQLPREWYELGRIVPLHHNVFSFFPLNAEMQSLLAMHLRRGAWAGMYLAQFIQTLSMVFAVVAVYGAVRRLRPKDSPAFAILAAISMAGVPWIVMLGSVAYDESALLLFGTAAVAWMMVALGESNHRLRHIAIAGALTGLACGVKYTAVPFLLIGIPVAGTGACLVVMLRRRPGNNEDQLPSPRAFIGHGSLFVLMALIVFSPWLVKNMVWTKNPIFPLAMHTLGHGHFSAAKIQRFEVAHTPPPAQRTIAGSLGQTWRELIVDWRFGYGLWPIAIIAIVISSRRWEVWFLGFLLLIVFIVWIGFTHLQSRFFVMGVPIAAMAIGSVCGKQKRMVATAGVVGVLIAGWLGIPGMVGSGLHMGICDACERFGRKGGFVLNELGVLTPKEAEMRSADRRVTTVELDPILADPNNHIALIGYMPFTFNVPMSRLSYCTVFDADDGVGTPQGWLPLGRRESQADRYILIDPVELHRLSTTYFAVPGIPADWRVNSARPILLQQ